MSGQGGPSGPLDEFLSPVPPTAAAGPQIITEFKPWHLPRKQLVRRELWANGLRALADDLSPQTPIRYLGLPGEDLLDLELIARVCKDAGRPFAYLGFDETAPTLLEDTPRQVAEQIVRNVVNVLPGSDILRHGFAGIAIDQSPAQLAFRRFGSFDVVNLDLCDALTSQPPLGHMHDALGELVRHQRNRRTDPWLLYLTLRGECNKILPLEREKYTSLLDGNCQQSADFMASLLPIAGLAGSSCDELAIKITEVMQGNAWISGRLTAIAVGKWLAELCQGGTPWRVGMLSLWGYRTGLTKSDRAVRAQRPPNMISVVFRFDRAPEQVADQHGLAASFPPVRSASVVPEPALASQMARCVRDRARDVDHYLASNPSLASELETEAKAALMVRNYDASRYEAFVRSAAITARQ